MQHVHDLVVPLALLLTRTTLEYDRSLRVLDHDGMVGAREHFHFALEAFVNQNRVADGVLALRYRVRYVRVFDHEPTHRIVDLSLFRKKNKLIKERKN